MSMEITGKVSHISEIEVFGQKQTQKRFIVIDIVDGKYTNSHGFQVFNDKCVMFDKCAVGDEVTIQYNLGTVREYNGKWYADMHKAWRVEVVSGTVPRSEPAASAPADDKPPAADKDVPADFDEYEDDLPF